MQIEQLLCNEDIWVVMNHSGIGLFNIRWGYLQISSKIDHFGTRKKTLKTNGRFSVRLPSFSHVKL